MKSPAISILVPIYNVEAYLSRCIESVLRQDFKDYELILVDDGSPDRCPQICDEYAARYDFIKTIHKVNGGLISARKAGVLAASGEYYMFLDSDDWLQDGALNKLYAAIQRDGGYDYVRGGAIREDPLGNQTPLESYPLECGEVDGTENFLINIYTRRVAPYLWGALYKSSLFSSESFDKSIEAGISYGEDTVTNMIVGTKVQRALYIKDIVYCYFFNPQSIVSSSIGSWDYVKRMETLLTTRSLYISKELLDWQKAKLAAMCFRYCFIPENGFCVEYDLYKPMMKEVFYEQKIRACISERFLYFVNCKWLFYLYTLLYRNIMRLRHPTRSHRALLK